MHGGNSSRVSNSTSSFIVYQQQLSEMVYYRNGFNFAQDKNPSQMLQEWCTLCGYELSWSEVENIVGGRSYWTVYPICKTKGLDHGTFTNPAVAVTVGGVEKDRRLQKSPYRIHNSRGQKQQCPMVHQYNDPIE